MNWRNISIKYKLIFVIAALILIILSLNSSYSFYVTEKAVTSSAMQSMRTELDQKRDEIQALHDRSSNDLVLAIHNPIFDQYFSLEETKSGNKYDEQGIIQFTPEQLEIKAKIDNWTQFIQSRMPVEETCLIDNTGQEHSRITNGQIASSNEFSSEEEGSDFFINTFAIDKKDKVNIAYPYMSADALKWVFAYSTPIFLENVGKVALYHFEMSISYFQDIVQKTSSGRTFVLDRNDFLIADSANKIEIGLRKDENTEDSVLKDYMPSVDTISTNEGFRKYVSEMKEGKEGSGSYVEDGIKYYIVFGQLPLFGWSIANIKSYDEMLQGDLSLNKLKNTMVLTIFVSLLISIAVIMVFSSYILRPLKKLEDASNKLAEGNLTFKLDDSMLQNKDEIGNLSCSYNLMLKNLNGLVSNIASNANNSATTSEELSASSQEVNASTNEISKALQQILKNGQALNKSADDTKLESDKLSSSINSITALAQRSAKNASDVKDATIKGKDSAKIASQKMQYIRDSVNSSAGIVQELGSKGQKITKVIEVINGISEQTNLLALNAAIEAARAGEAGRGFTVVADEVRKLAQESKKATKQIESTIKEIAASTENAVGSIQRGSKEVEEGSIVVDEALKSLDIISIKVAELVKAVDEINLAMQDQLNSSTTLQETIKEVNFIANQSVLSNDKVSESIKGTTESMQQVATAAQDLARGAEELKNLISKFKM